MRAAGIFLGLALGFALACPASDDTTPPRLRSLRLAPEEIQTTRGGSEVTLSLTASDDLSGVSYFEATFVDPTGASRQSVSKKFAPDTLISDSLTVRFPRFSASGVWTLSQVFLSDAAGNTTILNTDALVRAGFPTTLSVRSASDTLSPKLSLLEFAPEIDTSLGPAELKVKFAATDDFSGVAYVELSFASPGGTVNRGASAKLEASPAVSGTLSLTFPRNSDPGEWMLHTLFLSDAAGNTLILDAKGIRELGFPATLQVKSALDIRSPELRLLRFAPQEIDTSSGDAAVSVEFQASDDESGVKSFEVAFEGPSRSVNCKGSSTFALPVKDAKGAVTVIFPKNSEAGMWSVSKVSISDDAGNTLLLDADALSLRVGNKLQVR